MYNPACQTGLKSSMMKTMKSTIKMAFAIVFTFSVASCGNSQSKSQETEEKAATKATNQEPAQKILSAYLNVKDALVETDGEAASESAGTLVAALNKMEGELIDKIRFDAEHIAETKEASHQRDHFNTLSDNIYQWVKANGTNEATLYRQYCPMAFNNQGAFWLSSSKEILNPYFGDRMLRCGSVKETITKN